MAKDTRNPLIMNNVAPRGSTSTIADQMMMIIRHSIAAHQLISNSSRVINRRGGEYNWLCGCCWTELPADWRGGQGEAVSFTRWSGSSKFCSVWTTMIVNWLGTESERKDRNRKNSALISRFFLWNGGILADCSIKKPMKCWMDRKRLELMRDGQGSSLYEWWR